MEAGEFNTWAYGVAGAPSDFSSVEVFDDENSELYERVVTEVVARAGFNLMKPLTAKVRPGGCLTGMPDPVVVIIPRKSREGYEGKVIYLPEEKRRRYGKLLDKYEVSDQGPV